jgi:predicted HTH transcriptional regulator
MPTNALIILLGLMPFQNVRCSRFKGNNMEVFIDKKEFSGSLLDQLNGIIGFLKNHLFNRAEVVDIRRKERFEIPIPLLREIVVNALIHRDYTNNRSDIKVAIYDDRVEVISPGSLPFGLTVDEIVLGGRSESRNPNIANVFRHLHIMEQWGSGIQKVIDIATQIGLEAPEVRDLGNMVGVRFTRPNEYRKEKSFTAEMPVWTINGHPTDEDGRVLLNASESLTTRLDEKSRSCLGESEVGGKIKSKSSKTVNNEALLDNPVTRLSEESRSIELATTRLGAESRSNLSVLEHGEMILAILDVEGQITPRTFADKSGFSVTWTSLLLRDYEERGFLERFGKGRATHYKLNTNGKN